MKMCGKVLSISLALPSSQPFSILVSMCLIFGAIFPSCASSTDKIIVTPIVSNNLFEIMTYEIIVIGH